MNRILSVMLVHDRQDPIHSVKRAIRAVVAGAVDVAGLPV